MPRTRELEQQLHHAQKQLEFFQRISRMMARETNLVNVLQEVVTMLAEYTGGDSCLLYLLDGEQLVLCAANTPHLSAVGRVSLRLEEGLTGWVARERRLLAISREAYRDSRFKFFRDLPEDTYEAFLSAPIIARNQVVGVINVQHRAPHAHSGNEMELLSTVGEQIGAMLMLARLEPAALAHPNHAEIVLATNSSQD